MKNDVVDLDEFEKLINVEKTKKYTLNDDKIFWAMYYTVPTFHNPTGMTISPGNEFHTYFLRKGQYLIICCITKD